MKKTDKKMKPVKAAKPKAPAKMGKMKGKDMSKPY